MDLSAPTRATFVTPKGRALDVTRLGFGAAPLGNMHRALTEAEAQDTLDAAWDAGVRYFDTAPLYGHGLSEMRVGRMLRDHPRADYLVSTKVGRLLEPCAPGEGDSGIYRATPQVRIRFDYSRDGVMRSFESSLKRLGLDRVDILFVHDVDARTHGSRAASEARIAELIDSGGWRALDDLRAAGVVAAIGAGVNEWEPCARLLDLCDPDLFLLAGRYTLLEQEPLHTLFPACQARGVGIVLGGPYNSGILARPSGSYDYAKAPAEVLARVRALEAVCRRFGTPLAAAALVFAGAHPSVVSVIPGGQNRAEVEANAVLQGASVPLELWAALKDEGLLDPAAPVPRERVPC